MRRRSRPLMSYTTRYCCTVPLASPCQSMVTDVAAGWGLAATAMPECPASAPPTGVTASAMLEIAVVSLVTYTPRTAKRQRRPGVSGATSTVSARPTSTLLGIVSWRGAASTFKESSGAVEPEILCATGCEPKEFPTTVQVSVAVVSVTASTRRSWIDVGGGVGSVTESEFETALRLPASSRTRRANHHVIPPGGSGRSYVTSVPGGP